MQIDIHLIPNANNYFVMAIFDAKSKCPNPIITNKQNQKHKLCKLILKISKKPTVYWFTAADRKMRANKNSG